MEAAAQLVAAANGMTKALPPELQKAVAKVSEISSLPEITTRIVQVVEDPKATARDMHDIVRTDPALATKILKVVNSAFYGLPSQIASLDRAILMLGLSAVKNIALAASLARLFRVDALSDQFAARDLWRHCVAVGVCSRLIARRGPAQDELFVAGLVHDVGLIVSQQLYPVWLKEIVATCLSHPQSFCAAETRTIGADHQALGGALATRWRFPLGLRAAISYHHEPQVLQPEFSRTVAMVHLADILCCQGHHGFWLTAQSQEISSEVLELVGYTQAQLDEVNAELPARIEEAEQIFSGD